MFYFTDDFQMPGASLWNTYFRDGKTLLDAAYELLVWCIEEGYVKTKGGGNDAVNDEIKQGKEKE